MDVEKKAVDAILDRGVSVKIGRFKFVMKPALTGTMFMIAGIAASIEFSEDDFKEAPISSSYRYASRNVKDMSRVVAISILRRKLKIQLFSGLLSRYIMWNVTPKDLFNFCLIAYRLSDTASFIDTIRLISVTRISQKREKDNLSPIEHGG